MISSYTHFRTPLEKEEIYNDYVDECIENNEPVPDRSTFFLNQKFLEIQKKSYRYWNKDESIALNLSLIQYLEYCVGEYEHPVITT